MLNINISEKLNSTEHKNKDEISLLLYMGLTYMYALNTGTLRKLSWQNETLS